MNHTATLLADGRVLVAGVGYDAATAKAVLYDPVANRWIPTANMTRPRVMQSAVRLCPDSHAGGHEKSATRPPP